MFADATALFRGFDEDFSDSLEILVITDSINFGGEFSVPPNPEYDFTDAGIFNIFQDVVQLGGARQA